MPLNATDGDGGTGTTFWGSADYRNTSGGDDETLDWDGDLFSINLGFDARITPDTIGGVAVSWSEGDLDYDVDDSEKTYGINLTSVYPYLGWSNARGEVWMTTGYGEGELEITNANDETDTNDISLQTFAIGGSGVVLQREANTVRLKGEVSQSTLNVEANDDGLSEMEVDTGRVRLSVETTHTTALVNGARTERSGEAGMRYDGGDGNTGVGIELGLGFRYVNTTTGLSVEGKARALVGHDGDTDSDEWGVSGTIKKTAGADGQGLSFALSPGYGEQASDMQRLWQHGLRDVDRGTGDDYAARLNVRLGYGMTGIDVPNWFGTDTGLLTPYTEMTLSDDSNRYRLGIQWELGDRLDLDIIGEHRDADTTNSILLKGESRF